MAAGEEAVRRIGPAVRSTFGPEVLDGLGGFAGLFALPPGQWKEPVLAASTDGVGTKAVVAEATGRYGTIGIDLVAMCVDDLVCAGARPLFLLDCYTTSHLDPAVAEIVVAGVAEGCRQAGCALIGGEMAEHPGAGSSFDLAGFAVGWVERADILGPERVSAGDAVIGLASPGLRCNGYSLARQVLLEEAGRDLEGPAWPGAGHSLADELLKPSVLYSPSVLALGQALPAGSLHAAAHVTGGGLPGNLARALPPTCDALVEPRSWQVPRIFAEVEHLGGIDPAEMARVFNLGIGMVLVVDAEVVGDAIATLAGRGQDAVQVGQVVDGAGRVILER
jgi:phosphoribosylformylglycinamidine cyclo-ligase